MSPWVIFVLPSFAAAASFTSLTGKTTVQSSSEAMSFMVIAFAISVRWSSSPLVLTAGLAGVV
ncbi:hypothetical protein F5879DRAFT_983322 [Lentinula edodes]|nr:hypothetical protein F5879DRAFT_983322 [Lentinula edodes]